MLDHPLEIIVLVVFSLALRIVVSAIISDDFRVYGTLVGLMEGVIHHLLQGRSGRSQSSQSIPYAALALCNLIDFAFTKNLGRLVVLVVWAVLGAVLSDATWATPRPSRTRHRSHRKMSEFSSISSRVSPSTRYNSQTVGTSASSLWPRGSSETPLDHSYVRESPPGQSSSAAPSDDDLYNGDELLRTPPARQSAPLMVRMNNDYAAREAIDDDIYGPVGTPGGNHSRSPVNYARAARFNSDTTRTSISPATSHPPEPKSPTIIHVHAGEEQENLSVLELTPVLPRLMFPTSLSRIPPGEESATPSDDNEPARFPLSPTHPIPTSPTPVPDHPQASTSKAPPLSADPALPLPTGWVDYVSEASTPTSVFSVKGREALISRADLIRQEAAEEERVRNGLGTEMREALGNGRVKEAFLLKCDMEDAQMRADRLHQRAERRYYQGGCSLRFLCDITTLKIMWICDVLSVQLLLQTLGD